MPASHLERSTILHVASLSALSLTDDEATKMTAEIGEVLRYVEELAGVDTTNVPPTMNFAADAASVSGVGVVVGVGVVGVGVGPGLGEQRALTAWRADTIEEGLSHDDALAQAPHAAHDGFVVPGFVEG